MISPRVDRTLMMGVLNVTPDSFFDGGQWAAADAAVEHGKRLVADGADILDVGGESSRPGADPVSAAEEQERVIPIIERLQGVSAAISVDTYRASTAARAVAAGARMVNDITAFQGDPAMAAVVAESGVSCVLMHMRGTPKTMQNAPHYDDVVADICAFFEERVSYALSQGIAKEAIWLDPGFGFGKTVEHNLQLLARLDEFTRLGFPILIGASNKSTIGAVLGTPIDDRAEGTAATTAIAVWNGAQAVRVHDVKGMARVAKMTDAMRGARRI